MFSRNKLRSQANGFFYYYYYYCLFFAAGIVQKQFRSCGVQYTPLPVIRNHYFQQTIFRRRHNQTYFSTYSASNMIYIYNIHIFII